MGSKIFFLIIFLEQQSFDERTVDGFEHDFLFIANNSFFFQKYNNKEYQVISELFGIFNTLISVKTLKLLCLKTHRKYKESEKII